MSTMDFRHPFPRLGLRAGAVLRGRGGPEQLTDSDGAELVETVVEAVLSTRECRQGSPGWAWYLALAACFPNSPATHHASRRAQREVQQQRLRDQFGPDDAGTWPALPCAGCQQRDTTVRWGKSRLPLAAAETECSTQPPGGQPWCWWCRVGTWLLPYAASCSNRQILTVTSVSPDLEQCIVAAYTDHTTQAFQERWSTWADSDSLKPLRQVLAGCGEHELAQVEMTWWRNDNREPELTEYVLAERELRWWHRTWNQPEFRRGWQGLLQGTHLDPLIVLSRRQRGPHNTKDPVWHAFETAWLPDHLLVRRHRKPTLLHPEAAHTAALVQDYFRHCRSGRSSDLGITPPGRNDDAAEP